MNLSASFTQMSLFTPEPVNYVSSSLVVKGLKMFICRHAWASTSWYLTHEAGLWLLENVWAFSEPYLGQAEGSDLNMYFEILIFGVLGTVVRPPRWGYECKRNNFRPLEARPPWGAKYKSQSGIFRHRDRELLCLGACALEDSLNSLQSLKNEVKGDWTCN